MGGTAVADIHGYSQHMAETVCRWHPVEPELTHFHDIISLTFDIATDRGTSDTYRPFVDRPQRGSPWPWQRAVLTFHGGPMAGLCLSAAHLRVEMEFAHRTPTVEARQLRPESNHP
jgi:hypothetical protein